MRIHRNLRILSLVERKKPRQIGITRIVCELPKGFAQLETPESPPTGWAIRLIVVLSITSAGILGWLTGMFIGGVFSVPIGITVGLSIFLAIATWYSWLTTKRKIAKPLSLRLLCSLYLRILLIYIISIVTPIWIFALVSYIFGLDIALVLFVILLMLGYKYDHLIVPRILAGVQKYLPRDDA